MNKKDIDKQVKNSISRLSENEVNIPGIFGFLILRGSQLVYISLYLGAFIAFASDFNTFSCLVDILYIGNIAK